MIHVPLVPQRWKNPWRIVQNCKHPLMINVDKLVKSWSRSILKIIKNDWNVRIYSDTSQVIIPPIRIPNTICLNDRISTNWFSAPLKIHLSLKSVICSNKNISCNRIFSPTNWKCFPKPAWIATFRKFSDAGIQDISTGISMNMIIQKNNNNLTEKCERMMMTKVTNI